MNRTQCLLKRLDQEFILLARESDHLHLNPSFHISQLCDLGQGFSQTSEPQSPELEKKSRIVPFCQEAAEKIKGANTGKVLVGFREVSCFLLLLLLSLCLESGRGPRMVSTPFRGRAGTSSWRLAEDPVEEQTFSSSPGWTTCRPSDKTLQI